MKTDEDPDSVGQNHFKNGVKEENRDPGFIYRNDFKIIVKQENQDPDYIEQDHINSSGTKDPDHYEVEIKEENQEPDLIDQVRDSGGLLEENQEPDPAGPSDHKREIPKGAYCEICQRPFGAPSSLKAHQRIHTGEKPFTCDECGKAFRNKYSLKPHKRTHTGEKPFLCCQCGKSFAHANSLNVHQLIHAREKPYSSEQLGGGLPQRSQPYRCDQCGKAFTRTNNLKAHQLIHTGEKPYWCDCCVKAFTRKTYLRKHQEIHHGVKPHVVDQHEQKRPFTNHQPLHAGLKPNSCNQCGKSFTRRSTLKVHQRIHTGEKPYSCDQCGKTFIRLNQRKLHRHFHLTEQHQPSHAGGKPFKREQRSLRKKLLSRQETNETKTCTLPRPQIQDERKPQHVDPRGNKTSSLNTNCLIGLTGKPYGCDRCGKTFSRSHRCPHAEEKLYLCDQCGHTFSDSCTLEQHQQIHSRRPWCEREPREGPPSANADSDKPKQSPSGAECDECGRHFSRSSKLRTHREANALGCLFLCERCGKLCSLKCHSHPH